MLATCNCLNKMLFLMLIIDEGKEINKTIIIGRKNAVGKINVGLNKSPILHIKQIIKMNKMGKINVSIGEAIDFQ